MEESMKQYSLQISAEDIDAALQKAGVAVTYTKQNPTDEEKAQARENTGAAAVGENSNTAQTYQATIADMNIVIHLHTQIKDGVEVSFRSPADSSQVTGLILYYPENGSAASKEFAFADAHGNNVGNIDHLFAENVVVKVILDVTTGMAFVQNADTNAYLEGRFAEIEDEIRKDIVIFATPDTLAEAIAKATPNTTIVLTEGDYEIRLLGYKSYPENLTIKGSTGANVKAVEITSGLSINYNYDNADLTESIMPKGLTFTGVNFTGTFKVRNCGIEDLTITGCHFGKGAIVDISPNRADIYEHGARYKPGLVTAKNLVIRNNTFDYSADYSSSDENSTILISSVDDMEIIGNVINGAAYNGIKMDNVGTAGYESCGRISISNNTINGAGSRGFTIQRLKDAQLCIIGNMIKYANQIPEQAEKNGRTLIKIRDYSYTSVVCQHNKCVGKNLSDDPNGIYLPPDAQAIDKPTVPVDESHTHAVLGGVDHIIEQQHIDGYGICYRKWASGFVELWIEEKLEYNENGLYTIILPGFLNPVVHNDKIIAQCHSDYLHLKNTYLTVGDGTLFIAFKIIPEIEGYKPINVPVTAYITGFWTGTLD